MPRPTLAGKVTLDDSQAAAVLRRMQGSAVTSAATMSAVFKRAGASIASSTSAGAAAGGSRLKAAIGSMISPVAALGPAIAAAFAGKAIVSGVGNIFEAGRALQVLSRQTGASGYGLAVLQTKFKQAGLDADGVGRAIFRLQKSIGGVEDEENKGGSKRLLELGLSLAQLQKLSPDRQLFAVGAAISRIQDPAQRSATAMQIFGRAGAELGALFDKPGFAAVAPALAQKAAMLARNAALYEQISIRLGRIKGIAGTFYAGVAESVAKPLDAVLKRLEGINLVAMGQKFGTLLSDATKIFIGVFQKPGSILGLFYDSMRASQAQAINQLVAGFKYAGSVLLSVYQASPEILKHTTDGLSFALAAAAERFVGSMLSGIEKVMGALGAGVAWIALHGIGELETSLLKAAKNFGAFMLDSLTPTSFKLARMGAEIVASAAANMAGGTLASALTAGATGKDFSLGDSMNRQAEGNTKRAQESFSAAGGAAAAAAASPAFEYKDVAGEGYYRERVRQRLEALKKLGAETLTPPVARYAPAPVEDPYAVTDPKLLVNRRPATLPAPHGPDTLPRPTRPTREAIIGNARDFAGRMGQPLAAAVAEKIGRPGEQLARAGQSMAAAARGLTKATNKPPGAVQRMPGAGDSAPQGTSASPFDLSDTPSLDPSRSGAGGDPAPDASTPTVPTLAGRVPLHLMNMALASSGISTKGMTPEWVGQTAASHIFMPDNVPHDTAWGRTNASGPSTARVDATRRAMQYAQHTIGIGGALDFDPAQRPGWTGATEAGTNRSAAPFANHAGLSTGGLGGGAYGATGNIWHQLSGYGKGGKSEKGGVDKSNELLLEIKRLSEQNLTLQKQLWSGGSGSGRSGGGGTVAGR